MPTNAPTPMISLEHSIGQFHSLSILLPIIFFTGVVICDLIHSFGKPRAFTIGHWLVIAGVISCMPAIMTGLEAANYFKADNALLHTHSWLGFATGIFSSLYAGLRISTMLWKLPISKNWYLFMSMLLLALVSWTCDYGMLLSTL